MRRKILLTTTGSLGDLHPFIAIGLELRARGHEVTLATSNFYRPKVEQAGLRFAPMGPHLEPTAGAIVDRVFNVRRGPEYLIRDVLYPAVPAAYLEVMDALRESDLIVTHPITFAAQIAAEKTGKPWISTLTAPLSMFSIYDPSVAAPYPWTVKLLRLGPWFHRLINRVGHLQTANWLGSLQRFRRSIGLPAGRDPVFEGQHSPQRVLALFSALMAPPQPDWPPNSIATGFIFYDQLEHGQQLDPEIESFLDAGPAPVVFTLGSSAVRAPGNFYGESLEAVRRLGCRTVLLSGTNVLPTPLPAGVASFPYAPYSRILPRAAVTVHSGGIGTCAQALAAGHPMLVVPFAFDQPDNAARLQRLGVAEFISRRRYTAHRAFSVLEQLLGKRDYAVRAGEVARQVGAENGVKTACDAIETHPLS